MVSDSRADDEKKDAAKREELDLELAINEAMESGNDKLADKLQWQRDYNKLLKERLDAEDPDAYGKAIRGANAAEAGPIERAKNEVKLSHLARIGGSVGESAQAAVVQPQLAKLDLIHLAATRTAVAVENTHAMLEAIAHNNGGVYL